jgi:hypothetical protein
MSYSQFYDQVLNELLSGTFLEGLNLLVGMLDTLDQGGPEFEQAANTLKSHDLFEFLKRDPLVMANDAEEADFTIGADLICGADLPVSTSSTGRRLFQVTSNIAFARAYRQRRKTTQDRLISAWQAGQNICVIGHGQFMALQSLAGRELSNVTLISKSDQQADWLGSVFGSSPRICLADPTAFLQKSGQGDARFDLICADDVTDGLTTETLTQLAIAASSCLAPEGRLILAGFAPNHLGSGWRKICLGWDIFCHNENDFHKLGEAAGLTSRLCRDATNSVVQAMISKTFQPKSWGAQSDGY